MRGRGRRLTAVREAIYGLIQAGTGHWKAEVLYDKLRSELGSLSLATVYVGLDSLVESGAVHRVFRGRRAVQYGVGLGDHDHFHCLDCGLVVDVVLQDAGEHGESDPLRRRSVGPLSGLDGYQVERVERSYWGVCRDCVPRRDVRPYAIHDARWDGEA